MLVTALDSCFNRQCYLMSNGSSGPGSCPSQGHCVVFLGEDTLLSQLVPLSTQVYKWEKMNLMLEVTLRWSSTLSGGN